MALVIHELVHGGAFKFFGGKPTYGAGFASFMPYFYATSGNVAFTLKQMYVVGLSPFILLSILFLAGGILFPYFANFFAVAFIGNFSGAVGDLWLMSKLMQFSKFGDARVVDEEIGLAIFTNEKSAKDLAKKLDEKNSAKPVFINYWLWSVAAIFALTLLIDLIGPLFQKSLLIGPSQFPLIQYTVSNQDAEFSFNFASPIVGGLLFAFLAKILTRMTQIGRINKSK